MELTLTSLSTLHPRQGHAIRHTSSTRCFNPGAVVNAIGTRVTLDRFASIFDLGIRAESWGVGRLGVSAWDRVSERAVLEWVAATEFDIWYEMVAHGGVQS